MERFFFSAVFSLILCHLLLRNAIFQLLRNLISPRRHTSVRGPGVARCTWRVQCCSRNEYRRRPFVRCGIVVSTWRIGNGNVAVEFRIHRLVARQGNSGEVIQRAFLLVLCPHTRLEPLVVRICGGPNRLGFTAGRSEELRESRETGNYDG